MFLVLCFPFDVFSVLLFLLDSCFIRCPLHFPIPSSHFCRLSPCPNIYINKYMIYILCGIYIYIYTNPIICMYTYDYIYTRLYTVLKSLIILCLDFAPISDISCHVRGLGGRAQQIPPHTHNRHRVVFCFVASCSASYSASCSPSYSAS